MNKYQTNPESDRWTLPGTVDQSVDESPLLICGKCNDCGKLVFPKPKVCPDCMGESMSEARLSPVGKLYSYSILHRARKGWQAPYAIGYVDFPEGVRVMGPIELNVDFKPRCDGSVKLSVGLLRVDDDGYSYLSHRFVPID